MDQIQQENMEQTAPAARADEKRVSLVDEMRQSYLDYAMSVIVGRALPDVRDGFKPVHRRVLFAMGEMGNTYNSSYKKSARIVGEVLGKYHPHGDAAAYETLVRMAQPFSLRYTLVDGQGNFGSVDGDGAAAMRYTEVRLAKIANEMLADIKEETVDFQPNFDGSEQEPTVLPSRLPNLLVNGSAGIAVGMATNIPPHNLCETIDACLYALDNPGATVDALMERLPAPDFPTGGIIWGLDGVREGYRTGRGRVIIRAKTHFETCGHNNDRDVIVVDEIPYQVNKREMVQHIANLIGEKKLVGITALRDESDKSGMRVVMELAQTANKDVLLNQLFQLTELQSSFGMNLVALVDGQPRTLNLKEIIDAFLRHRREVLTRRTVFRLRESRRKGHLQEGLAVALDNIDEFIRIIRASKDSKQAKADLMARAWPSPTVTALLGRTDDPSSYRPQDLEPQYGLAADGMYWLSPVQVTNILSLQLQRLTGLERENITAEYERLIAAIADYLDILAKPARVTAMIREDMESLRTNYGDARRTEINRLGGSVSKKDLIARRDMVVMLTKAGYIKAQPVADYAAQTRGGKGRNIASFKDGDRIDKIIFAGTHDKLFCFTDKGRAFAVDVWDLPEGTGSQRGRPIVNYISNLGKQKVAGDGQQADSDVPRMESVEENISAILPIRDEDENDNQFIFMATSKGFVKKSPVSAFANMRSAGLIACDLEEGDHLIGVAHTSGHDHIMLFSSEGQASRFGEDEVRAMGRAARGVRGMKLPEGACLVSMLVTDSEDSLVLTATENGYGKCTPVADYPRHGRYTQGVRAINTGERNGKLVTAILVDEDDEVMCVSSRGKVQRTRVADIRQTGRAAAGVRLIDLTGRTSDETPARLTIVQRVSETQEAEGDEDPAAAGQPEGPAPSADAQEN